MRIVRSRDAAALTPTMVLRRDRVSIDRLFLLARLTGIEMLSNGVARRSALAIWDIVCWTLGAAVVIGLRYSFRINEVQWESVLRYLLLSWLLLVVIGIATKFYRGRFLVG